MGNGRWSPSDWDSYAKKNVSGKSASQIFTSSSMKADYNPAKIEYRESRDSKDNPISTPIILASDVTGSMGMIAHTLMQKGLNTLAEEIYDRKPVTDPHIMVMAVGDAYTDRAPIQMTQFEADIRLADQVKDLYVEGNGGGNGGESYALAHLAAAFKVRADAFDKRKRKGYLFTIGDEPIHPQVTKEQIKRFLNVDVEKDYETKSIIELASRNWEIFHIVLANEGYACSNLNGVMSSWTKVLPERTIKLEDVSKLGETVTSLIQVYEGANATDVANSWSGDTSLVIHNALRDLTARKAAGGGVRRLR